MRTTEISNGEFSEGQVLIDVADILQGGGDDRVKARILNRHQWVAVGGDDVAAQMDGNKLFRATGRFGKPEARVFVEGEALWDVRLDEQNTVCFREWYTEGGDRKVGALWFYWDSDLPEMVPLYEERLDVDIVGDEAARYARSAMYRDLLHVPIYDDEGLLVLGDEAPHTALELLEAGHAEIESVHAIAYKNRVLLAKVELANTEAAEEYQQLLWAHLRMRSPKAAMMAANRMYLPGDDKPAARRGRSVAAKAAKVPTPPAVKVAEREREANRGWFSRLLGR